jgi:signal transduction histidine kinase
MVHRAGKAIRNRWVPAVVVLLVVTVCVLHFGTTQVPQQFLMQEEERMNKQVQAAGESFAEWVLLSKRDSITEMAGWSATARRAGLPEWQLQVFQGDSPVYWSPGRLTAVEDALTGVGWMRMPRQITWRFDTLVGPFRYRYTLPLLVYQSGNWRFSDPAGRVLPGSEPVEFAWNGKPADGRNWFPYHKFKQARPEVKEGETSAGERIPSPDLPLYWTTAGMTESIQPPQSGLWAARLSLLASLLLALLGMLQIGRITMPLSRRIFAWLLALIAWRLLLLPLSTQLGWERLAWFDPGLFASHRLLPSLGDLWLYLAMLWSIPAAIAFYPAAHWRALLMPLRNDRLGLRNIGVLLVTWLFTTLSWLVTRDLLVNGGIPLSFNELTGMNSFTLPAFLAVVSLILYNTLIWGIWMRSWLAHLSPAVFMARLSLSVGLWIGILAFTGEGAWIRGLPGLWLPLLLILGAYRLLQTRGGVWPKLIRVPHAGHAATRLLLVYFAMTAAYQLADGGERRRTNQANEVAARLTNPYDERAITELSAMIPRLRSDSLLLSGLYGNEASPERWQTLLTLGHLTGYLDRYQLVETCFLPDLRPDSLIEALQAAAVGGESGLRKVASNKPADGLKAEAVGAAKGNPDSGDAAESLDSLPNPMSLIRQFTEQARQGFGINVPLPVRDYRNDTLYLRLLRRDPVATGGMWGLASSRTNTGDADFAEFSFALYKSGLLQRSGGSISYPLRERDLRGDGPIPARDGSVGEAVNRAGMPGPDPNARHLINRLDDGSFLVVSFRPQDWLDLPAMAIALLLMAWLLILLFEGVRLLGRNNLRWQPGYRERIGLGLVATSLVTVVTGAYATLAFSIGSREASQRDNLAVRLENLYTAIAPLLNEYLLNRTSREPRLDVGSVPSFTTTSVGVADYRLAEIANRMQTDFALYDGQGRLLYSSLPQADRLPLVTSRIEPLAWQALAGEGQSRFVHRAEQRWVDEWSAYRPIFPRNDRISGVLQLVVPRSDSIGRAEHNAFLGNLLRLYLLLLLFSFLLSYSVARGITRPIRALTLQMMRNRLGVKEPMAGYPRNDEVGLLIQSYNELLLELQESARLLARSEREQTWRQVARQIAHEIRNPLTPMKLKLQRLLRDQKSNPGRFMERFQDDLSVVLEQIDVLAAVSDEFGAFARSEPLKKSVFDLRDGIQPAVALFGHIGVLDWDDQLPPGDGGRVVGDVQQVQRVFQNLLRNAQQAVPDGSEPCIGVRLERDADFYRVELSDNGQGIPESFADRIFEPNFTTKGSGMGLGLAIVSRIVEQHSGKISFKSTPGAGTIFTLLFPVYRETDTP